MDPPALMSDEGYNLAEIWQYPMSESGIRRGQFGPGLGQFGDPNREVSGNDPVSLEQPQQRGGGVRRRRDGEDEAAKVVSTSSGNGVNDGDGKRLKASGGRDENHDSIAEAEPGSGKPVEQKAQPPEPSKQDYIHVRARRGQATDSHSLAERARREKISEKMKILQDLVPGCNKVIGKALVLDEIINYIQSLQHQVEFLSMKLEAVNSRMNPAIEVFPPKDYANKHLMLLEWHLVHKREGNTTVVHHQSGCILVVLLKEQYNIEKPLSITNKSINLQCFLQSSPKKYTASC